MDLQEADLSRAVMTDPEASVRNIRAYLRTHIQLQKCFRAFTFEDEQGMAYQSALLQVSRDLGLVTTPDSGLDFNDLVRSGFEFLSDLEALHPAAKEALDEARSLLSLMSAMGPAVVADVNQTELVVPKKSGFIRLWTPRKGAR